MTKLKAGKETYVGIDVAMEWLDVALHPQGKSFRFANSVAGIADLAAMLAPFGIAKIVLEATGGLEYAAALYLKRGGLPVAVVNPARTAAFRVMTGKITKTDATDAKLLALFAQKMEPEAGGVPDEEIKKLKELIARRRQLLDLLVQERNRLQNTYDPSVKQSVQAMIGHLKQERERIETLLIAAIEALPDLRTHYHLLKTIPAVGPVVAATLVTDMPELGTLTPKQIASLAGLAPHNMDSGKSKGKAATRGGRTCVRAALYMAAIVAIRRNPVMKDFYQRLVASGKPKKLAIVAVMRKLVIVANQILKTKRPWQNDYKFIA